MRPMMWSSGTTGGQAHTGELMASEISRVISEVEAVAGVGKVIAVVSHNAANMKKAGRLVELRHPNVVFNGCSAHTMNLLLKDMFKIRAKRRALPKRAKTGELSAPVSTRWYAQEKCIKSVARNKSPLKAAFADTELMLHYADAAAAQKLNDVVDILQDKHLFTRALANFETDTCSNSMILHEFERLKHTDVYTASIPGLTDPSVQAKILALIDDRWKFITPPSNSTRIAYLLDPSKDTSVFIGDSMRDTVAGAVKLAERFGLPPDISPASFRLELLDFIGMKKSRTAEEKTKAGTDTPLHWWLMDEVFPKLHRFAEKMLSVPTSSAASERLWSVHEFTQTKLRNSLRANTVEKLAFIYTNNGDSKPTSMPLYQTPSTASDYCSDSDSDDNGDEDDDECLFDLRDAEFEYLLDSIVSVDIASEEESL
ncbi:hAT family C-terminal dimerization region [Phytophthora infestans]|uniref:HAT family C-terminal dimerization region n=1 Tax=Phytophthora infestans TaxID=4787 RepID=A0A8S9V0X2_PHYIN|nr:hAT family C-terminal dimerization region [Phytophthora infestans]